MNTMTSPSHRRGAPARALLHPLWLGALAVLATNDHLLKGSGLLPGVVTGKISDFAGLVVAPVLLAAILGVRTRRAFVVCHMAVGIVFAAIQLSEAAAAAMTFATGLVGHPWVITRDPTDLAALPALALSAHVFWQVATRPAKRALRRTGEWAAATAGLYCCVATSPPGPPIDPLDRVYEGRVFVWNATEDDVLVQVQSLRDDLDVDCSVAMSDPGHLLVEDLFGIADVYSVEPEAALDLARSGDGSGSCQILRVSVTGGGAPFLVPLDPDLHPVQLLGEDELVDSDATIQIVERDAGGLEVAPNDADLVVPIGEVREAGDPGTCPAQSDADRLFWDVTVTAAPQRIESLSFGPDGCIRMDLLDADGIDAGETPDANYVCVPESHFPFAVGDWIEVRNFGTTIEIDAVDETGAPALDGLALSLARSALDGSLSSLPSDLAIEPTRKPECTPAVYDTCGTVAYEASISALRPQLGGAVELGVGDAATLEGSDGSTIDLLVVHALDRRILDPTCVSGPAARGFDVEIAAIHRFTTP